MLLKIDYQLINYKVNLLESGGGNILLEDSDLVLKNYNYVMLESFQPINLATQTRDYADNATYESDAIFEH